MNSSLSYSLLISLLFLSCKDDLTQNSNQFQTGGSYNITIHAVQYDEFNRRVPSRGSAKLTLITSYIILYGTLLDGDSLFTFHNAPSQTYILKGEKEGFYPFESTYNTTAISFYPLPSPDMKIDSILIVGEYTTPSVRWVRYKIIGHQKVPSDGSINVLTFFGWDTTVGPKPGTNFATGSVTTFGSNEVLGFFDIPNASSSYGTTIYITARLASGATKYFYDSSTKATVYTNLENNSKVITSFTY